MKITTKTTKEQLKSFLGANAKAVKTADKDLFDQIAYADKMAKKDDSKVTRKDLVDLVKSVMTLLGDKCVEPALAQETPATPQAENSVKKLAKGVSKKQETKEETSSEESGESEKTAEETQEEAKTEKVDDKSAKKSLGGKKKSATKKEGVTALEGSNSQKTVQMAKQFPQTIEVGDSKYELATDIKSMDDLYEALNKDEEIVFAYYWSRRHLRQFDYFVGCLGQPKSFDNDLDLATTIYVSDEKKVAYQVSMYTEAMYTVLPKDFEDEDGIRVSFGMEYQIYRAV